MPPGGWALPTPTVGIPPTPATRPSPLRRPKLCRSLPPQAKAAMPLPSAPSPNPSDPLPYPHAHPHAPDHTSHSPDDSSFLRRQSLPLRRPANLAPRKGGVQRGTPPFGKGSGGCAPSYEKNLRGWAGGPNQRRNAGSSSPPAPALFPFVDFTPFFTGADGPRSARALADTTCPPFSTVSTPPSGALGPSSGPCLADTTCLPLSTCPSRCKPKLERVSSGTEEGKRRAAQFKAIQTARPP